MILIKLSFSDLDAVASIDHSINMDSALQEDFFCKFSLNSKVAENMFKKFPPNKQQQYICDRLHVPYVLWSFFVCKKESLQFFLVGISFAILDSVQNCRYFDSFDMDLTDDEKYFILFHESVDRIRQECFCIQDSISNLQNQCLKTIIQTTNLHVNRRIKENFAYRLPQILLEQLLLRKGCVSMPKWEPINMRAKFVDTSEGEILKKFFKKKDTALPKEFVVWFQNDNIHPMLCNSSLILIIMWFKNDSGYFNICMKCMKWCLEDSIIKSPFKREYFKYYLINNLHIVQDPKNWCERCKQVPMFQILTVRDCEEQYNSNNYPIKIEMFL